MNSIQLINDLISDTNQILQRSQEIFKNLDQEQLRIKPSSNKWSIYEVVEHMNIANNHYIKEFDNKLKKHTDGSADNSTSFKSGLLGNYFVKSMKPHQDGHIPSKMKTLPGFKPKGQENAIEKFLEDQNRLIEILEECKNQDLNKVKIVSAIGRIITFRLGDALRFITAHNQRHMIQIKNLIKEFSSDFVN